MLTLKFILKSYLFPIFLPTGFLGISIIIAFICLLKNKYRLAKLFLGGSTLFILLFSLDPVVEFILSKYEGLYPVFKISKLSMSEKDNINYIVVLAGGYNPGGETSIVSTLTQETLTRLVEGVVIKQNLRHSKLILTGKGYAKKSEASVMRDIAVNMGVDKSDIILDEKSENTFEHTLYLKDMLKNNKFILVTSAIHMPRAMGLFQKANFRPIPAPTNHHLVGKYHLFRMTSLFPNSENLEAIDKVFYEFYGYIWLKFTNKI